MSGAKLRLGAENVQVKPYLRRQSARYRPERANIVAIDCPYTGNGDTYELDFADDSFDLLINNYMFDLLPQRDFSTVLLEFRRVLRPGGRLAMVNMTLGERWYNGLWKHIYAINPALIGGCRGVSLLPELAACGFTQTAGEYMSQFTFPSEIVTGVAP